MKLIPVIMKFLSFVSVAILAGLGVSTPVEPRASNFVGYLISTFSDPSPKVQMYLSKGNDPSTFNFLNKGQPVLTSTVGTRGVRDIFLATNTARNQWFLIATGK